MKIFMLGTGTASAVDIYHTCFVLEKNNKYFVVDGGGGSSVLAQLKKVHIDVSKINDIFLSHIHLDHCLGILWIIRKRNLSINNKVELPPLKVYGSKKTLSELKNLMAIVLKKEFKKLGSEILFVELNNDDKLNINDIIFTFFDTLASKDEMFGFIAEDSGKKLAFVGDETIKEPIVQKVKGCDLLMHDAFCVAGEFDDGFLKRTCHTTAEQAGSIATTACAKSLLLFHTMDNNLKKRKNLYTKKASINFSGKIYVPNDLEIIELK